MEEENVEVRNKTDSVVEEEELFSMFLLEQSDIFCSFCFPFIRCFKHRELKREIFLTWLCGLI